MQLAAWIGVCLAAAFLLRKRVRVPLAAVLGLWLLVPAIGSATLTGVSSGPMSVHAATWLVATIFLVRLLHDPASLRMVLGAHFLLFLILGLVIVAAYLATSTSANGGGMVLLVDQLVVPVLFFLLLLADAVRGAGLVVMLRTVLLALVALVCAVAVAQWLSGNVLLYEAGFKTQYWFARESGRWMGTLDQPLALSLFICLAAPLLGGVKRRWLQLLLLALMAVGMLISQSRVGLAALAVTVVATVIFAPWRTWTKAAMLLVVGAGGALIASPLVAGVAARVADDSGSAEEARGLAFEYFLGRWGDYAVAGEGSGASFLLGERAGLETSFESPTVMYSVDFGVLFALLYFGSMAVLVLGAALRTGIRSGYPGLLLAGLMAVVIPQTYSSLATRSAAGILVWTVLAMVVVAAQEGRKGARQERAGAAPAGAATAGASAESRGSRVFSGDAHCSCGSRGDSRAEAGCTDRARSRPLVIARRQFLGLAAAGAVLGVAGCSSCPESPAATGAIARPRPAVVPAASAAKEFVTTGAIAAPGDNGPFTVANLLDAPSFFVAHRGSGDNWPEHTMRAYKGAAADRAEGDRSVGFRHQGRRAGLPPRSEHPAADRHRPDHRPGALRRARAAAQ